MVVFRGARCYQRRAANQLPGCLSGHRARCLLLVAGWLATGTIACPGTASARIITVRPGDAGDAPTIQAAVDAAGTGDIVELADGTYSGPGNRDIDLLGKAITVRSASGRSAECVIDCAGGRWDPPHRGFICQTGEGAETKIIGLTITHGQALGTQSPEGSGGAILCRRSSPTISDCVFVGNRATSGGAVACEFASPTFERCVFRGNTAEHGGGMQIFRHAPRLLDCRFEGNTAAGGGGVNCWAASPELRGCRFDRNAATLGGAFSCAEKATPRLLYCVMSGNFASLGGGLLAEKAAPRLNHCTLVANSAGSGGGICGREAALAFLHNCIIAFSQQGEAIACDESSQVEVACTLIYGNGDGDWIGCLADWAGRQGNLWTDPLFVAGERGDFSLRPESPGRRAPDGCGQAGAMSR